MRTRRLRTPCGRVGAGGAGDEAAETGPTKAIEGPPARDRRWRVGLPTPARPCLPGGAVKHLAPGLSGRIPTGLLAVYEGRRPGRRVLVATAARCDGGCSITRIPAPTDARTQTAKLAEWAGNPANLAGFPPTDARSHRPYTADHSDPAYTRNENSPVVAMGAGGKPGGSGPTRAVGGPWARVRGGRVGCWDPEAGPAFLAAL